MNDSILNQIDIDKLYHHVLKIEGIRHPMQNSTHLEYVQHYIISEFQRYGLFIKLHTVKLPPFSQEFWNIEASFKEEDEKAIILSAHYDSVFNCPGAMDNAGSIAIILEIARLLSKDESPPNVKFLLFTLEEFNPAWVKARFKKMQELELMDEKYRYLSSNILMTIQRYKKETWKLRQMGKSPGEAIKHFIDSNFQILTPKILSFLNYDYELHQKFNHESIWGNSVLVGSNAWINENCDRALKFKGIINLDALGFRSIYSNPNSAISEKINSTINQIPTILIIFNKSSQKLAGDIEESIKKLDLRLNSYQILAQGNFSQIARNQPDLLRSDHTSFWRYEIPAIFVTDFSDPPNPYYHTPADTIDKIDFRILGNLTKAILNYISNFKGT